MPNSRITWKLFPFGLFTHQHLDQPPARKTMAYDQDGFSGQLVADVVVPKGIEECHGESSLRDEVQMRPQRGAKWLIYRFSGAPAVIGDAVVAVGPAEAAGLEDALAGAVGGADLGVENARPALALQPQDGGGQQGAADAENSHQQ